jgi:hypothetical protein
MSVDADIWSRVASIGFREIELLNECGIEYRLIPTKDNTIVVRPTIWSSWFDESYPRGNWPDLSNALTAMRNVFGHVFYTNDHMSYEYHSYDREFTVERQAQLDKAWEETRCG